jgi:beta-lactam-binding protein with PASTA domain
MKSFIRLVLLALILMTVALVSALTAMRLAIHGREVSVPKLVGLTLAEAERTVSALGLQIVVERQYYSPNIAEGKIMSQLPQADTRVRRGWQVRVAQSLGPQRVEIPDVVGESEHAAELNISRRGLDVGAIAQIDMPGTPANQVISQSPPASASGVSAPKIGLLVTTTAPAQAFIMPNFVGQPLGSATLALRDAGLRLGSVTVTAGTDQSSVTPEIGPMQVPSASPASIVVKQTPVAGQKVIVGSLVDLEVKP